MTIEREPTLTGAQVLVLVTLKRGPARLTRERSGGSQVNFTAATSLAGREFVLMTAGTAVITQSGCDALEVEQTRRHNRDRRPPARYGPKPYSRTPLRSAGAPCRHCDYRAARLHSRFPHLATDYCSDRCKTNHKKQRERNTQRELAESIRSILGLPGDRGPTFTIPELEAMDRRLRRLLPYGGMAMRKARNRRTG